jgi:hypothetical protein
MEKERNLNIKLQNIRKDLLDISIRNPLINYKPLRTSGLEINEKNHNEIYDNIVKNKKTFHFLPIEDKKNKDSYLKTNYSFETLQKRLLRTMQNAKKGIEEYGFNTLFLTIGSLVWFDENEPLKKNISPLILIPVKISRENSIYKFSMSYCDTEPIFNHCLYLKMKNNFFIDLPLLDFESDFSLESYFEKFKNSISSLDGWTLNKDSINLSFFSFSKIFMYKDLDPSNWNLENKKIIQDLLNDGFKNEKDEEDEKDYIEEENEVLEADFSQKKSIIEINKGKSIVIQGPPGTGKSQTITNIIADQVLKGKSILFVSEKLAALEIVRKKMEKLGFGDMCLEIHSNKTNKRDVHENISKTLKNNKIQIIKENPKEKLKKHKIFIQEYLNQINDFHKYSNLSFVDALDKFLSFQEKNILKLEKNNFQLYSNEKFEKLKLTLINYFDFLKENKNIRKNVFWGAKISKISEFEIEKLHNNIVLTYEILKNILNLFEKIDIEFFKGKNIDNFVNFLSSLEDISTFDNLSLKKISSSFFESKKIDFLIDKLRKRNKILNKWSYLFEEKIWSYDLKRIRNDFVKNKDNILKYFIKEYTDSIQFVKKRLKNSNHFNKIDLVELFDDLFSYHLLNNEIKIELHSLDYSFKNTDIENVEKLEKEVKKIREFKKDHKEYALIFDKMFKITNIEVENIKLIKKDFIDYKENIFEICKILDFDLDDFEKIELICILDIVENWKEKFYEIEQIINYNFFVENIKDVDFEYFIQILGALEENEDIPKFKLVELVEKQRIIEILKCLNLTKNSIFNFNNLNYNIAAQSVLELSKEKIDFNRLNVMNRYSERVKNYEKEGRFNFLKRECSKKSHRLSIRKLLSRDIENLKILKPVWMMSPISVSTFLESNSSFDIVIFDEASQIKPIDALGSILRAKQVVVVGDSKQMPPSSFFESLIEDEEKEKEEFISDMESILDLFVNQNANQTMLNWHYRSHNPLLINFSNSHFYENQLTTFPSVKVDSKSDIEFFHIPHSFYDRGKSQTNIIEAKEIIKNVVKHSKENPKR